MRVEAGALWGLLRFRRNDEDISSTVLAWQDGPVRVVRRARISIRLGLGLSPPEIIGDTYFTADTLQSPVLVRLPFDLRYVFGELAVRIYLDFKRLEGHRIFTASGPPSAISCSQGLPGLDGAPADWFAMTGPKGGFVHALRVGQSLNGVHRTLYLTADEKPDPPEEETGNCPGIGYTLTHWRGVGRGTHRIDMIVRAFDRLEPDAAQRFLDGLDRPLRIEIRSEDKSRGITASASRG